MENQYGLTPETAQMYIDNPWANNENIPQEELEAIANPVTSPSINQEEEDADKVLQDLGLPTTPRVEFNETTQERQEAVQSGDDLTPEAIFGEKPGGTFKEIANNWIDRLTVFTTEKFDEYKGSNLANENLSVQRAKADSETYDAEVAEYMTEAQEIYDNFGTPEIVDGNPTGRRIYERVTNDPETGKILVENVVVPKPEEMGPDFFNRVFREGFLDFRKDLSGAMQLDFSDDTGKFELGTAEEDKDFIQSNPTMELTSGEQLLADVLTLAPVTGGSSTIARGGLNLLKMATRLDKSARVGGLGRFGSTVIGASLADTLIASEGQSGIFLDDKIQDWAKAAGYDWSASTSRDVGLLLEGLLLNGALDGLLTVAAPALINFGGLKAGDTTKLSAQQMVKSVKDGQVLNVVNFLDPEILKSNGKAKNRKLIKLSEVLRANSVETITIGNFAKDIDVTTTIALASGAEAYIRETRQNLKNTFTKVEGRNRNVFDEEAWEAYVEKEANEMFARMVALMKANSGDPRLTGLDDAVIMQTGEAFKQAADQIQTKEASQVLTDRLVVGYKEEVDKLLEKANIKQIEIDEVKLAKQNILQDSEEYLTVVDELYPFGDMTDQTVSRFANNVLFPEFVKAKQAYQNAFDAVPNTPIGQDAAEALMKIFKDAVENSLPADKVVNTNRAKQAVKSKLIGIFNKLSPQPIGGTENTGLVFEQEATFKEITDRVSQLGFADLWTLKPVIARLKNTGPEDERAILIELGKHLNGNVNEKGEAVGQIGYAMLSENSATAEAAIKAQQLWQDFDNRFRDSEFIKPVTKALEDRLAKKLAFAPSTVKAADLGTADVEVALSNAIDTALGASFKSGTLQRELSEAVGDSAIDGATETSLLFRTKIIKDVVNSLSPFVDQGLTPLQIRQVLQEPIANLRASGSNDAADQLQALITRIENKTVELGDLNLSLTDELNAANDAIEAKKNSVIQSLLSKFKDSDNLEMATEGPATSINLQSILINTDTNNTKQLLAEIDKLPTEAEKLLAKQVLQAEALDLIGGRIFGASTIGTQNMKPISRVNQGQLAKLSNEEATGLLTSLDLIFDGQSGLEDVREGVVRTLAILQRQSMGTFSRGVSVGSNTSLLTDQARRTSDAVSTGILLVAGYMNPTAAFLRRLSSIPLKELAELEKEVAADALAVILAQPEEFATLIDRLRKNQNIQAIKGAARQTVNAAYQGGKYNIFIREEEPTDEEIGFIQQFVGRDLSEGIGAIFGAK